jgi:16S rRNA (guanine527-N7)-methyltransferase
VARHVEHGRALLAALPARGRAVDLGSGGGLPGLVIATHRPDLELTLVEARRRACRFLREAAADLGLTAVDVVEARAVDAARRPDLREQFDAVVARSFGPPPVTAECAVGFLRTGGHLVVSEPPAGEEPGDGAAGHSARRWPAAALGDLGFAPPVPGGSAAGSYVVLEKVRHDDRWPRRVGIPAKRPLWTV